MAPITFDKTFTGTGNGVLDTALSLLPIICGIPQSTIAGNPAGNKQVVHIYTYPQGGGIGLLDIYAWLQEKIVITTHSNWVGVTEGFDKIPGVSQVEGIIEDAFLAANKSLRTTLTTRRKWAGSDPITITLKLRFEAFNNVESEVLQPCRYLQELTLPRGGLNNTFFLTPPGPNPFGQNLSGEVTAIDIGAGFLRFPNVVVEDVKVTYENRMSASGPIGAEVEMTIKTYQMYTKERLEDAYGHGQALQNVMTSSSNLINNATGTGLNTAINTGINAATNAVLPPGVGNMISGIINANK